MFLVSISISYTGDTNVAVPQVWVPHGVGFLTHVLFHLSWCASRYQSTSFGAPTPRVIHREARMLSPVVPAIVPAHQSSVSIIRFGR